MMVGGTSKRISLISHASEPLACFHPELGTAPELSCSRAMSDRLCQGDLLELFAVWKASGIERAGVFSLQV